MVGYIYLLADEQGGVYTADRKRLLKVQNVKRYRIVEGCEKTDEHAFDDCKALECLNVPESYSHQAAHFSKEEDEKKVKLTRWILKKT